MILFQALRNPPILFLWIGQSLSAIGDELYRMAFVWIVAGMVGPDTGYFSTLQMSALLMVTLFGGIWADRWNPFRTLITVDIIRFLLVLIAVVSMMWSWHSLAVLVTTSILISGLGGFFEPLIKLMIPAYCETRRELQGATGLMSTTFRLARVVAPVIIGELSHWVAPVHFFTLDSGSFIVSALSILYLWKKFKTKKPIEQKNSLEKTPISEVLGRAIKLLKQNPNIWRVTKVKFFTGGLWYLAYGLTIVFLVKAKFGNSLGAYSVAMNGYGIGNIVGALYFGNRERKRLIPMIYNGFLVLGAGFMGMALAPSLILLFIASAFSALGGPINDIPYHDIIQSEFPIQDVPIIYRFTLALETGAALITFGCSPFLFREASPVQVLFTIGLIVFLLGIYGTIKESKYTSHLHQRS